jgi:hypothetical protein
VVYDALYRECKQRRSEDAPSLFEIASTMR